MKRDDIIIYPVLISAAFAVAAAWFSIYPLKLPFNSGDVFVESSILLLLVLGNVFVRVIDSTSVKLGWGVLTLGFLVDLLDEFTKEPDIVNTFMDGMLKIIGLGIVIYGFVHAYLAMRSELASARKALDATKSDVEALNGLCGDRQKVEEMKRLATIGEVATMIGHDLRNPLQAIVYSVYDLEEELKTLPEDSRKVLEERGITPFLEKLKKQVEYMNKIVTDLQDYASMSKLELFETNLHKLVEDALKSVRKPENVTVRIEADPSLPPVSIDPQLMRRVFINFITNAYQAMPKGGSLEIDVRREGGMAVVSFKDTGVGIPPENMKNLFNPFFTTKPKGMGLGLAICKRIIEAHKGKIEVASEVGKGTQFTIRIPLK